MPKISIIVPVYNTEKYLRKCLDSLVNQTYTDIEIIVVNDGSTDNSQIIIDEYKEKYPEIISFDLKENTGIANVRNFAIGKITGDYFLFVDSDDYIEKTLCESLINELQSKKFDIIKYKMQIIDNGTTTKISGPVFDSESGQEAFNILCFADKMIDTPCLYLFNTAFYKNHDFKFMQNTYHEDFGLIPLIIISASKIKSANLYGYNYIQCNNSITRNYSYNITVKRAFDLLKHYDNILCETEKIKLQSNTKQNLKQYYTNAILSAAATLVDKDKHQYVLEIKKRNLIKNIKVRNFKQLMRKIIIVLSFMFN